MKTWLASAAIITCIVLVASSAASADVSFPGQPQYANKILGAFEAPTIKPGQAVTLKFNVSNPYTDPVAVMENVRLTIGVYRYATQEKSREVTADFPRPPLIAGNSTEETRTIVRMPLGDVVSFEVTIYTSKNTPHGSYFSQSTYFIRFNMTFNFEGNTTKVVLKSRGWFTDEQWDAMVNLDSEEPVVNTTYMKSLGVDGLLPDSSFGLKIPIPRWPLALIIVGAVGLSFMGLYYYVLENPGRHPGLEQRFYYLRGKLHEFWGKFKHGRGK